MITLAEVQAFCAVARAASTSHALLQAVEEITAAMGFRYFALVHHIDLLNPAGTAVRLVNYPRDWVDAFEEGRLYAADPIHRASHSTTIGFAWSKVAAMISLHPRDYAVLAAARSAGLGDGL
ncbi:autoinducer binding domain-containing protein [Sphingobium sp. C100]|jgi:LuxR family quorum-sensing system transcriptional regulator CciR|uniref:autoinducer binding domain-containing protein n=1 Tax=Sphingobium sp. C100 TaxID=1207055 RepID=UPI00068CFECE|nr:autoinducer binding domain-containing protein [Sphingobium sp. C100]